MSWSSWSRSRALPLVLLGGLACSTGEGGTMEFTTSPPQPTGGSGGLTNGTASASATAGDTDTDTDTGGTDTTGTETTGGPPPSCGDGMVDAGEECDQGAKNSESGLCTPLCTLATCGDGYVYPAAESCDEGMDNAEDAGCLPDCTMNTCGDGFLYEGVEECDDGNTEDHDGCTSECQIDLCGNGEVDFGETCDDGNQIDTDACLSTCEAASCGDGFLQEGVEECDDGDANADDAACLSTCVAATCGDGFVQAGVEACDEGMDNAEDGACLPTCEAAACGDGFVQAGVEECDDGNVMPGDGCDASCKSELVCGKTFTTDWCLQNGTKGQYTRCESVTNQGTTCINPEIRYGNVTGGIPRSHNNGNTYYPIWCQQLGFSGYAGQINFGMRDCTAPKGGLFPCNSYDEAVWKWCDWQDGAWYNQSLGWHGCNGQEITSFTCTK
ncbi:MAG: DUF4215 domain-containing protein [Myxococcales bacterium]|nr:DUF4215 domain-containing protein [Myxococcales bacterium]